MRSVLFWGVCIPVRTTIARYAAEDTYLLRAAALVIGARWLSGLENGNEGVFGGPAWWAEERPLHGALWTAYALSGQSGFLYADTGLGIVNWSSEVLKKKRL